MPVRRAIIALMLMTSLTCGTLQASLMGSDGRQLQMHFVWAYFATGSALGRVKAACEEVEKVYLLASLMSASVSTNIFMSKRSLSSAIRQAHEALTTSAQSKAGEGPCTAPWPMQGWRCCCTLSPSNSTAQCTWTLQQYKNMVALTTPCLHCSQATEIKER